MGNAHSTGDLIGTRSGGGKLENIGLALVEELNTTGGKLGNHNTTHTTLAVVFGGNFEPNRDARFNSKGVWL